MGPEFVLFAVLGFDTDCDVEDVIILSLEEIELDIWASWPESFFVSDAADGVGIPEIIREFKS